MPVIFGVTLTASAKLGRAPPCKALKARGFLHAGLDPALAGLNLTAEMRDIGLACLKDRPRTGPHLRHRARSREQQDSARRQDFLFRHDRCSIAYALPRAIAPHYYSAGVYSRNSFLLDVQDVSREGGRDRDNRAAGRSRGPRLPRRTNTRAAPSGAPRRRPTAV